MDERKCPCCPNHCERDNLSCGRGKDYFSDQKPSNIQEQVVSDLRHCGHLLHHNKDLDYETLLSNLSVDDLHQLHELLSKIVER